MGLDSSSYYSAPQQPNRTPKAWPWVLAVCITAVAAIVIIVFVFMKNGGNVPFFQANKTMPMDPAPTPEAETITDPPIDYYAPKKFGKKTWMTKNMRNRKDRDGNVIKLENATTGQPSCYCPDGKAANVETYGYLYNWEAAKKVCPEGWHLPSKEEWEQLKGFMENQKGYLYQNNEHKIAKAMADKSDWDYSEFEGTVGNDPNKNNKSQFAALPAGGYSIKDGYGLIGKRADFWTANQNPNSDHSSAYYYYLSYNSSKLLDSYFSTTAALSVRCVKD